MKRATSSEFTDLGVFLGLSQADLEAILARGQEVSIRGGEAFYRQDDAATALFVLVRGRVKLSRVTVDGRQIVVQLVGPGHVFGGVTCAAAAHPEFAVAMVDSRALCWTLEVLHELCHAHPQLALNVLEATQRQLGEAYARLGELATARAEQRVALALVRLATVTLGTEPSARTRIELPASREDLAQMAGTTLYTVSRVIAGWERQGVLELGRQRVSVLRWDELRALAGI